MKRLLLTCNDICKILQVSHSKAYEVIRKLNEEMEHNGYITVAGKVNVRYFSEKSYISLEDIENYLNDK